MATLPINDITPVLHRLYRTVEYMQHTRVRALALHCRHLYLNQRMKWYYQQNQHCKLDNKHFRMRQTTLREAFKRSRFLPKQILTTLEESLNVPQYGITASFDHLNFVHWINLDKSSAQHEQELTGMHTEHFQKAITDEKRRAVLNDWVLDLKVISNFFIKLKQNLQEYTATKHLLIEHAHLKSWQPRGYKAQWWHIDRGIISGVATVDGLSMTEYLHEDPAPYPDLPPGFDAFVFPDQLTESIKHVPSNQLLLCGGRSRKETGLSYLWHRAPICKFERIVLVVKTVR